MTVGADELDHWRQWIGRTSIREERLDVETLRRYAAALGEGTDVEIALPSLAHWAFFLPAAAADRIGPDGHERRGGDVPPISLPRRMFAGASMRFAAPLTLDEPARQTVTIVGLEYKRGRTGDLVLMKQEIHIQQFGSTRVSESRTIVYRDGGEAMSPVAAGAAPAPAPAPAVVGHEDIWTPTSVELFRFSAATANSHRIHYDRTYAVGAEGYPDLVVHGPLTAARLYSRAAHRGRPAGFAFRAFAPLFVDQPVRLASDAATPGEVAAIRLDGVAAMRATATY